MLRRNSRFLSGAKRKTFLRNAGTFYLLFEHDLLRKPVLGFRDHVLRSNRPGLFREISQHLPQAPRRLHAIGERQPQAAAPKLKLDPFRIEADALPRAVFPAQEPGGVEPDRVGMV